MSTTTINAGKQTNAGSGNKTSWSAARDAPVSSFGINFTTTQFNRTRAIQELYSSGPKGDAYLVNRAFFYFDTSVITDNITAIDLKVQGVSNSGRNVRVAKSTAYGGNGGTAYASSDFDSWTSTNGLNPTPYNDSNHVWSSSTNTIALNSTAITDANNDSYLILVIVGGSFDYPNSVPLIPFDFASGVQFASTTVFPQLFITHSASGYGNLILGLPIIKYDKVNSIARSDISEIIGV
tara:strand:+ start:73 stop:783 length:711 start_codon:yes stop_codon:yes gene_type:complete